MTIDLILSIIDSELKIVLVLLESMTPDQRQALWTRHEERQRRWDALIDRLTP